MRVRGRAGDRTSSWDILGRWAAGDRRVRRTSVAGQGDDLADVAVDTWRVDGQGGVATYQVQVRLMRRSGASLPVARPSTPLHAVATRLPAALPAVSKPGPAPAATLDVPRYSQMSHVGHSPGVRRRRRGLVLARPRSRWCSATTARCPTRRRTSGSARATPTRGSTRPPGRRTTAAYEGTGNWPFNTAYAASLAGHAFVTRLASLRAAEQYVAAGIPLVLVRVVPEAASSPARRSPRRPVTCWSSSASPTPATSS